MTNISKANINSFQKNFPSLLRPFGETFFKKIIFKPLKQTAVRLPKIALFYVLENCTSPKLHLDFMVLLFFKSFLFYILFAIFWFHEKFLSHYIYFKLKVIPIWWTGWCLQPLQRPLQHIRILCLGWPLWPILLHRLNLMPLTQQGKF